MTPAGIALLVIGIFVVVASFFVPDNEKRESKKDIEKKQEQIRRLMETELDGMKLRVNEATNETVEASMEKSERALEKITNDKIMAVNEYASVVMEEIDRNHKEVMFLYDMLSDKQTDVKNTVRHAEAAVKEANDAAKNASDTAMYAVNVAGQAEEAASAISAQTDQQILAAQLGAALSNAGNAYEKTVEQKPVSMKEETTGLDLSAINSVPTESVFGMAASLADSMEGFTIAEPEIIEPIVKKPQVEEKEPERELTEFEILERNTKFNNVSNNNQMILKMNAEGIPAVDIARQLKLGVGEVQLVIDLFK